MAFGGPLRISTPSDTEILTERDFAAPRDLVFACYTQPPLIKRWLTGPPGWTMPVCVFEARAGGRYRYEWHKGDERLAMSGVIHTITMPEHIRSEEGFDQPDTGGMSQSLVDFEEKPEGTTVINRLTYASKALRDQIAATGMADGMEMSFKNLDALLVERKR
ncbi:ATPase [Devosia yakushimensis]|uniref:ATPase n=1 Tax=Devosia yakushimensis TaxID=470028 RepID=A0ABQ5UCH4_9HYPH|nr:SRPBCC domain-containing protein [Devosia yakushimensis]GLQ09027.1 ATPase [Devosia yakushimensis]